jgi:prepilin-type N-terminal cleavage/methylation domain-containing protein
MSDKPLVMNSKKGFTIVELAVVLVLVGILISLGVSMIGPLTKRARESDTKVTIDAAIESLVGYAVTNHRLPTVAEFTGAVKKPNDAWGNPLYYIVDNNLTAIPSGANDAVCGRRTTGITVRNCITDNCATTAGTDYNDIPNVAFIIASGGENFNVQTAVAAGRATVYIQNGTTNRDACTTAGNCPNYTGTLINRPERYDDAVKWITLNELRTKIGCQGAQMQILNNELPPGSTGTNYVWNVNPLATIFAQGGIPYGTVNQNYRWCIQTTAPAGLVFRNTAGADITGAVFSANCSTYPRTSWPQSDTVIISGQPTAQGSYKLTFFSRDNNDPPTGTNDNINQKSFVLTISP